MRRRGVALILIGLFLILFLDSYVVQWIGYLMVATIVLSYLYSRTIRRGLTVKRHDPVLRTYLMETVTVRIEVENRSFLPLPYLAITDNPGSLYSGDENSKLITLRPGEKTELVYDIKGMNRGAYRIGPITTRFTDPLGIYPVAATIHDETRLIVYPRIHPIELPVHRGLPAGSVATSSRIYEDPTRYRSVREYVPGDEIRKVNWKASARLGELHSTEWLPTINHPVMIILNLTASSYERRNRYAHTERTINAAASLVHHLAQRGQEVGLVSTGIIKGTVDRIMPWIEVANGMQHAIGILETLAQITTNELDEDPVERFLSRSSVSFGTRIFYLGAPLHEEAIAALATSVGDRSLIRLYFTEEGVSQNAAFAPEAIRVYRITEYGDELFTIQA